MNDEPSKADEALKRWAATESKSIVPLVLHAQYLFDDLLNYDVPI